MVLEIRFQISIQYFFLIPTIICTLNIIYFIISQPTLEFLNIYFIDRDLQPSTNARILRTAILHEKIDIVVSGLLFLFTER